ncbi:sensor histidine kinase [Brassicibacter mesophilus]|uniref:sensor histidine kinase n=1 Tax=Brassicibacter mesophilus TaxID=745119 RepID=UPI003D21CD31
MNSHSTFSAKKIYSIFILIFTSISGLFFLYLIKLNNTILEIQPNLSEVLKKYNLVAVACVFSFLFASIFFMWITRVKVVILFNNLCDVIDNIIAKKENINFDIDKETLLSKLENKLKQLIDIVESEREQFNSERNKLKSIISDISHQVKTPLANVTMINDTLLQRKLTKEQERDFLKNMKSQLEKLKWLMDALIKMSRLETGIIALQKENLPLYDTIAQVIGSTYIKAQQKNINIELNCDKSIALSHDKKWTNEALFNIVENAVKYCNHGGNIDIEVDTLEIFTRININDNGMGIEKDEITNIFKRFYRGKDVSQIEGVGIGLYLTREIISKQGGYLKVKSKKGIGTMFSVFLPN